MSQECSFLCYITSDMITDCLLDFFEVLVMLEFSYFSYVLTTVQ